MNNQWIIDEDNDICLAGPCKLKVFRCAPGIDPNAAVEMLNNAMRECEMEASNDD